MSNRGSDSTKQDRPRVLKSHQVAGVQFAFPQLEQVAESDLPPSLSAGSSAPAPTTVPAAVDAERRLAEAREAEERARALERRAAAFLTEAEETAHARLTETERQIEEMLAKTAASIDEIEGEVREKAYQAGHNDGYQAGLDRARSEAGALLQQARQEAASITAAARTQAEQLRQDGIRARAAQLDSSKAQLLDLAFAMARQVLKAETALRPEAVVPMLEAALTKLKGEEEPQIRVSPEVRHLLEEQRGRLMAALPGVRHLSVEGDPSLAPGDFVVRGTNGLIDGRLENQLKNVEEALQDGER